MNRLNNLCNVLNRALMAAQEANATLDPYFIKLNLQRCQESVSEATNFLVELIEKEQEL